MSEIKVSNISNRAGTSGVVIAGVTSSIGTGSARLASGDNSERVGIESGSIRYNETAKLLEFYDGTQWNFIIPAEESANALGVFGGGYSSASGPYTTFTNIDYITISTLGDAKEFGNLTVDRAYNPGCSSSTRGLLGGGYSEISGSANTIDYITFSTTGNATDFGDLSAGRKGNVGGACASSTRGVFAGGEVPRTNIIDYVTIATTGNATDFGDLSAAKKDLSGCSSSTRGVFSGGTTSSTPVVVSINVIEYITIATTGNAQTFGTLRFSISSDMSFSSSTRGIIGLNYEVLDYITIATTGNAQAFGDTSFGYGTAGCSSSTRGIRGGGFSSLNGYSNPINTLEYITIATFGNSVYFGDLTLARGMYGSSCSNNHGGLL
jgi:hypothetical protein